jgi:hypothetical protein
MDMACSVLPGLIDVLGRPFTGFVVNFNARTLPHRDVNDKDICLLFVITDGEEGEVVLDEPGIAIRLYNGDFMVFRSRDFTHYNCEVKGRRLSFVLSTDRACNAWVENRNNWSDNLYFH